MRHEHGNLEIQQTEKEKLKILRRICDAVPGVKKAVSQQRIISIIISTETR